MEDGGGLENVAAAIRRAESDNTVYYILPVAHRIYLGAESWCQMDLVSASAFSCVRQKSQLQAFKPQDRLGSLA